MTTTFDSVLSLDDAALRMLLDGTDARNRLWAIWALAIRGGATSIAPHLAGEPSPGVRRHMCIVLAGGELDLLVALARHDPDVDVRATASGLCTRLAGGGRLPWALALEVLESAEPAIRQASLREVPASAPENVIAAVLRAAEAPEVDVALEAIGALVRVAPAKAVAEIARRLASASDAEAYALVTTCVEHLGSAAALHDALLSSPAVVRIAAVRQLGRRWIDIAPFANDPDHAVRLTVRRMLMGRLAELPREALVTWIGDGEEAGDETTGAAAAHQLANLREERRAPLHADVHVDLHDRCKRRRGAIEATLREARVPLEIDYADAGGDDEDIDYEADGFESLRWERRNLIDLIDLIERAGAHEPV